MSMTLISTVNVGAGGTGGIGFTGIPQTYTDLLIKISARSAYGAVSQYWVFVLNSQSPSTTRTLTGNGSGVSANGTNYVNSESLVAANATANTFNNASVYIPNYTASSLVKSATIDAVGEHNGGASMGNTIMSYSAVTGAVTSIEVGAAGQTIVQNSTVSLYGILKGSGGATVS